MESCALVERLNYQDEDIHVYLVRGKEAPKSIREASSAVPVPDRRASKRSRRTTGNSISLKVSGSTSVYQLKLMIWESLGVCHAHQKYNLCRQPITSICLLHF
jgi:ubiquitin carboxyl-terminal hydrolase 48